ncbi:putative branched-chain amino acid transport ATP-binding protein LivG [Halalkalicoccus paucihalophilus]|uniref:Putative branched-chain amino acid transport ATP-binding protein LivG n=1 Tax=Halalkalicoccus paucihalophilus TaxID=1008153 RepID=A0A151A8A7_9EURY|nr:ABC transporter ATP-binding protein [Halalkalicoccus paucihalophilus]KYH23849.1 putative branched-chain amino acid transport ATP-binding protein LivG [Halalkalicoccus paucihalophilus]
MSELTDVGGENDARPRSSSSRRLTVDSIETYYGDSHVLFDVSLSVGDGEIVALVGRNGAGKTTTLRSIMGLTPAKSGRIEKDGESIHGLDPHQVRKRGISWIPEERRVFGGLTVDENLRLAAHTADTDQRERIEEVYDRFSRLDERRTQKAGTMSGGEQQMLAIARALLGPETDLLLLDEPSEGLAPQIVKDVESIIRELNEEGVTVLLVEQNAEMALGLADRAYVLETGEIVHESSADELLADRSAMEQYLGVQ